MSAKQQLAAEVEALPESISIEEAVDRLYRAFKLKRAAQQGQRTPLKSPAGLWEGLGINLTSEDIDQARKEMWADFPRDDI